MEDRIIELRDVGPVHHLRIPLPEGGGIVILRGDQGVGKSHSLNAVNALIGNKSADRISSRDASLGAQIEGLGVRLTIGRRASRGGEVEVAHLEGEDPSLLVDPGFKSHDAADAARIKALLRLARAKVDVDAFAGLVGSREQLEELCRPTSLDENSLDVPAMAASIKRDLEAAARKAESATENAFSRADGVRDTLKGLQGEHTPDLRYATADEAREAHTRAVREHEALKTRRENSAAMVAQAREAREALAEFGEDGSPEAVDAAQDVAGQASLAIDDAKEALERAKAALKAAEADHDAAVGALGRQQRAASQRARLQKAVDAAADVGPVPAADVDALARAIESAESEVAAWALHERTANLRDQIAELQEAGKAASERAVALREAAVGTEAIVLDAVRSVCGDGMELHEGRLYVHTDRGRELFSDLSHGERWRMALDIAVAAIGENGLLVVRQEGFEGLSPRTRAEVAEHAKRLGVVILTAEAADGDIRAEEQTT